MTGTPPQLRRKSDRHLDAREPRQVPYLEAYWRIVASLEKREPRDVCSPWGSSSAVLERDRRALLGAR